MLFLRLVLWNGSMLDTKADSTLVPWPTLGQSNCRSLKISQSEHDLKASI